MPRSRTTTTRWTRGTGRRHLQGRRGDAPGHRDADVVAAAAPRDAAGLVERRTAVAAARDRVLAELAVALLDAQDRAALDAAVATASRQADLLAAPLGGPAAGSPTREGADAAAEHTAFLDRLQDVVARGAARLERERARVRSALHDPLTGLPGRRLLSQGLDEALRGRRSSDGGLALLLVDLDGFKGVNDTHGHAGGDEVLVALARRLRDTVRAPDLVARLGGDEFVVLCHEDVEGAADRLADRIAARCAEPVRLSTGTTVGLTASVGVARPGPGADDALPLLAAADAAMYARKPARPR